MKSLLMSSYEMMAKSSSLLATIEHSSNSSRFAHWSIVSPLSILPSQKIKQNVINFISNFIKFVSLFIGNIDLGVRIALQNDQFTSKSMLHCSNKVLHLPPNPFHLWIAKPRFLHPNRMFSRFGSVTKIKEYMTRGFLYDSFLLC